MKIVNTSDNSQPVRLNLNGVKKNERLSNGKLITLKSRDLDAENTLDNPNLIVPVESRVSIEGNVLESRIDAHSFYVFKFDLQ